MQESINHAKEELKRADHLIYVSLKYTRTVDVIRSIIDRLLNAYGFMIDACVTWAIDEQLISSDDEVPESPIMKSNMIKTLFSDNKPVVDMVDFYLFLRKVVRAEYTSSKEYRRPVTMGVIIDGEQVDINIDVIHEYYESTLGCVGMLEEVLSEDNE